MRNAQLHQYFTSLNDEEKDNFAKTCSTTVGQIQQIMYGHRSCNPILAIAIDRESGGMVSCDSLCPDADFSYLRNQKEKA